MKKEKKILWIQTPEYDVYPAAGSYLGLIYDNKTILELMEKLRSAPVKEFKAKDIFRASGFSLLGISNSHIKKDQKKIKKGIPLSPILLVRDTVNGKLVIADGYHRLCAVYSFDEDAMVPCKIV